MSDGFIDINQINTSFGGNNEPKDEHLMVLLGKAYQGEIMCRKAIIPMELITPFSEFTPTISEGYAERFAQDYEAMNPPELYVYEKDGKFIMSDDYQAYYMYKAVKAEHAICVVIGETTLTEGIEYGPEFKMPLPSIEVEE